MSDRKKETPIAFIEPGFTPCLGIHMQGICAERDNLRERIASLTAQLALADSLAEECEMQLGPGCMIGALMQKRLREALAAYRKSRGGK